MDRAAEVPTMAAISGEQSGSTDMTVHTTDTSFLISLGNRGAGIYDGVDNPEKLIHFLRLKTFLDERGWDPMEESTMPTFFLRMLTKPTWMKV